MASHPIVHIEIPADEPKTTGEFYAKVFDWKLQLDPTFSYLQFQAQGGPGGAFVKIGDSITENNAVKHKANSPLMYIGTDDIDGDLSRIEANGGKVVAPKSEIPGIGSFAVFTDPTGNTLALFAALPNQGG
jgi:uncharacterized protein